MWLFRVAKASGSFALRDVGAAVRCSQTIRAVRQGGGEYLKMPATCCQTPAHCRYAGREPEPEVGILVIDLAPTDADDADDETKCPPGGA